MSNPVKWNPFNKVVQDHNTGAVDIAETDIIRQKLGLPIPWEPKMVQFELQLPPIYEVLPQSKIEPGLWVNKKTGDKYRVFDETINATNAQNGQLMVAYRNVLNTSKTFVREVNEFLEKFRSIS